MGVAPASFTFRAMESARARTRRTICVSMACALGEACRGAPSDRRRNQRSVSGPAIWTFAKGSLRCSTSQRNGRSACHDVAVGTKESRPCPCSRVRSRRASKIPAPRIHSEASRNAEPSGSVRRPGRPSSACGTMYSAGSRRGSWGAAGTSRRSACCSASSSWVWGRLPMLLVASEGRAAGTGASYPFAASFGGIKRARACSGRLFFQRLLYAECVLEDRQRRQILGPRGGFLGSDDILQRRHPGRVSADLDAYRARFQAFEGEAAGNTAQQDVDRYLRPEDAQRARELGHGSRCCPSQMAAQLLELPSIQLRVADQQIDVAGEHRSILHDCRGCPYDDGLEMDPLERVEETMQEALVRGHTRRPAAAPSRSSACPSIADAGRSRRSEADRPDRCRGTGAQRDRAPA